RSHPTPPTWRRSSRSRRTSNTTSRCGGSRTVPEPTRFTRARDRGPSRRPLVNIRRRASAPSPSAVVRRRLRGPGPSARRGELAGTVDGAGDVARLAGLTEEEPVAVLVLAVNEAQLRVQDDVTQLHLVEGLTGRRARAGRGDHQLIAPLEEHGRSGWAEPGDHATATPDGIGTVHLVTALVMTG